MSDEHRAFEELHRSTCRELLAYLRRRSDPDRAADLLAEVYLVAWRRRADLPSGDERRLWLYGVARRVVLQHGRGVPLADARAVRSPGREGTTGDDDAGAPDPRAVAVREALARLRDVDRELITLTAWERLSVAEAAVAVGLTPGTARVRLHRARARLARDPELLALIPDAAPDPATSC